jgi:glycosyltransferase involved in cell wall biosynthesis
MLLGNPFTHDARVEREARALAAAGHAVDLFCTAREGLPETETRDGFRVVRVPPPRWLGWTGPRRAVPLLLWFRRYGFLADAAFPRRPQVVHGHDLEMLLPAARLARRLGALLVHDDHEFGIEKIGQGSGETLSGWRRNADALVCRNLRRRGEALERAVIPGASLVLTVNEPIARMLETRYGRPVVVVRNVPSRSDLPPDPRLRQRAGLPPDARVALYQGTITAGGGGQEAVEAAGLLPEGWFLVFLGVTWMRGRLEALAREKGVVGRVRFLDPVPPGELPGFTRAADVGLAPLRPVNLGQEYSLANKVFEYLHAGLPIVSSDIPVQAELVRGLDAGVVLAEVTPGAIAGAVRALAGEPEEVRAARRDRLRAGARERHCWEVESRILVGAYDRMLRARSGAGAA